MDPSALWASFWNQCFAVRAESPVPRSDGGKFGVEANCFTGRIFCIYSVCFAHDAAVILA